MIEVVTEKTQLIEKEQYWIDYYIQAIGRPFVANHCLTAGNLLGYKLTPEHKRNISKSLKGKPKSIEHREGLSQAAKGRIVSEETKLKLSESHKNRVIPQSQRKKTSKSLTGRKISQVTKDKMAISQQARRNREKHPIPLLVNLYNMV